MVNKERSNKIFLVIIAVLVIANIAMLIFFLTGKEPSRQNRNSDRKAYIASFLQKEIGFNQQQLQTFDTLSSNHRERISQLFEKMRANKGEQFKKLALGNFTDSVMNAVADESATSQKEIELVMFNHLKNIRMLCTPQQLPKFDTLFPKILNRRNENRKKNNSK